MSICKLSISGADYTLNGGSEVWQARVEDPLHDISAEKPPSFQRYSL
jgi:hypothetical protein